MTNPNGILLVSKETGSTSFHLVSLLRRLTHVEKIGHAGTLDPFAIGVMVMLIGPEYTKKSEQFLKLDKQYVAVLRLGVSTDSYDIDGKITKTSDIVPSLSEVEAAIQTFQGEIIQTPPMFSAKKIQGKKLYELARKGIEIPRVAVPVRLNIVLVSYEYPNLEILIDCSKGTYIRSLAHDLGLALKSFAHLQALTRTKCGPFTLEECIPQSDLLKPSFDITPYLKKEILNLTH